MSYTLKALAGQLAAREVSSAELVADALDRIGRLNPVLNAFITVADRDSALAAARQIAVRLAVEVPEISAGIGVGYGPVVAGNVGAIERFEYTVIGDPVNESARLSELAKRDPRRPVASARTIDAASSRSPRWAPDCPVS